MGLVLVGAPAGAQEETDLRYPPEGDSALYFTGTWLYATYQAGTEGGLSMDAPSKEADDLAEYHATPAAAARLLVGEWYTEPLAEDLVVDGVLTFSFTVTCDTYMQDILPRFYLATSGGRDTGHQYNLASHGPALAGDQVLVTGQFEMDEAFEVAAGDQFGLWLYAGGTGDPVNCFMLYNSAGNPGYVSWSAGAEEDEEPVEDVVPEALIHVTMDPERNWTDDSVSGVFTIENGASAADTVDLNLSVPANLTASVSLVSNGSREPTTSASLDPGSNATFEWRVSGFGPGYHNVSLEITSDLGHASSHDLSFTVDPPPEAEEEGVDEGAPADETQADPEPQEATDAAAIPGLGLSGLLLGALAAVGVRARRD